MFNKCHTVGLPLMLAAGLAVASGAADSQTSPISTRTDDSKDASPASNGFERARLGMVRQTTTLLGKTVKDREEKSVGKLEDLVVELPSGRVVAALVSAEQSRLIIVPAHAFAAADSGKILVGTDRKTFQRAPYIDSSTLRRAPDLGELTESFRHFGRPVSELPTASDPAFGLAKSLLGQSLVTQADEPLGHVQDLMVDLPRGRVVYVVIKPAVGPDQNSNFYVIPPTAVRAEDKAQVLQLAASQEQFLSGPHFQKDYWPQVNSPEMASAVAAHYGLQTAGTSSIDSTRQPVRTRVETANRSAAFTAAAAGRSDDEITDAILFELIHNPTLSMGRNLRLITHNGRVTLEGQPRDENQRRQIISAAESVVGPANVDNKLETQR